MSGRDGAVTLLQWELGPCLPRAMADFFDGGVCAVWPVPACRLGARCFRPGCLFGHEGPGRAEVVRQLASHWTAQARELSGERETMAACVAKLVQMVRGHESQLRGLMECARKANPQPAEAWGALRPEHGEGRTAEPDGQTVDGPKQRGPEAQEEGRSEAHKGGGPRTSWAVGAGGPW